MTFYTPLQHEQTTFKIARSGIALTLQFTKHLFTGSPASESLYQVQSVGSGYPWPTQLSTALSFSLAFSEFLGVDTWGKANKKNIVMGDEHNNTALFATFFSIMDCTSGLGN